MTRDPRVATQPHWLLSPYEKRSRHVYVIEALHSSLHDNVLSAKVLYDLDKVDR